MKVKLATQLFSNGVADVIEYCNLQLKIEEFKGSEGTVEFLRMFNDLFDILNSRSVKHFGFKRAACKRNIDGVQNFVKEVDNYISNLKISEAGRTVLETNRKTGFLGFKIYIQSLLYIANKFIRSTSSVLKYFPSYKISQDHIESSFHQ